MNGNMSKKFEMSIGIKQGNSVNPLLFIIIDNTLSIIILSIAKSKLNKYE